MVTICPKLFTIMKTPGREGKGRREGAAGAHNGGGRHGGGERGVRRGDRGIGGRRGHDGGGTGRGRRGGGGDRGGRVPPDRVVQGRERAGTAHAVPGRGRRDDGGAPVRAVRGGTVRGRVHRRQRRDVLADPEPRAGALGGGGRRAGHERAGHGAVLRAGRGPALGRAAGPGDDRAGFGAAQGGRRGQGLGRRPEPAQPAAL